MFFHFGKFFSRGENIYFFVKNFYFSVVNIHKDSHSFNDIFFLNDFQEVLKIYLNKIFATKIIKDNKNVIALATIIELFFN